MNPALRTILAICLIKGGLARLQEHSVRKLDDAPDWAPNFAKPLPLAPPHESPAQESNETSIDFEGVITRCDSSPQKGSVPFRSLANPNHWSYWSVDLQAGRRVEVNVTRRSCGMDPAFYLFFNTGIIVGSGDDELAPPEACGEDAPFRDAQLNVRALPFTGQYVVGVFDNAGQPDADEEEASFEIRIGSEDVDGDGIGEACDRCPFTKLEREVSIQDCGTGIKDVLVSEDGCSLGDLLPGILKTCDKRTRVSEEKGGSYSFTDCVKLRQRKIRKEAISNKYTKSLQRKVVKCARVADRDKIAALCGNRFFAADKNSLFIVDPHSGQSQFVGLLPACSAEIIYDQSRKLILNEECGGSTISQVDPSNADLIKFEKPHIRGPIAGLEYIDDVGYCGTWVARKTKPRWSSFVIQNNTKSKFTVIGPTGKESIPGLSYDQNSGKLLGITGGSSQAELLVIDIETGKANFVANLTSQEPTTVNNFGSTDFGPDGDLFGGITENGHTWPSSLVKISPRTGKVELIGNSDLGYRGLTCYCL